MSTPGERLSGEAALPIAEVERLTGIRQSTLRMWEKRYDFPRPLRDRNGDRIYPLDQVERLQAAQRLIRAGVRPGRIFADGAGAAAAPAMPQAPGAEGEYRRLFGLLRGYRVAELHLHLQYRLMELGLRRLVTDCLAPLTAAVQDAARRGDLPLRCALLYGQQVAAMLQGRLATVRSAGDGRARALLATLSGEPQALGILMAETVLTTLEVDCIQLGVEVPPREVAAAAAETGAGIVVLSFKAGFPRRSLPHMVGALRAALPPSAALWLGGEGVAWVHGLGPGIDVLPSLDALEPAFAAWSARGH